MKDNDYTKAVIIRFNGKNEYKIRSYRADEIRDITKDNRIIIEDLWIKGTGIILIPVLKIIIRIKHKYI